MPAVGPFDWRRLTPLSQAIAGPAAIAGLIVPGPAGAGNSVTLYDGVDATGNRFAAFEASPGPAGMYKLPALAEFPNGVFADFGGAAVECVLFYMPLPS